MKLLLKFLPLMILYIFIVVIFSKSVIDGDQGRYFRYAQNITEGYFTSSENPYLASGPGYPLYLSVFVGLGLPLIIPKLFNGLLIIIGLVFIYLLNRNFTGEKVALVLTYILGLYLPIFGWIILNIPEPLVFALVCMLIYYTFNALKSKNRKIKLYVMSSVSLSALILTKFIFFYVTIVSLIIFSIYFLISRNRKSLKYAVVVFFGFLMSTPYLMYTYSITGKHFYPSTASGLGLYWMSSKYENEVGSCLSSTYHTLYAIPEIHEAHKELFTSIEDLRFIERNDIITKHAVANIKNNPKNYVINIMNNISRLLFNFPHSYRYQSTKTHWFLIYNFVLLIGLLITVYPTWVNRKSVSSEIVLIGIFFLIYFGGSSMVIGLSRMFFPIVPFLFFWNTYIFSKYIKIKILSD